jgi:hypothetical protein
MSKVICGKLFNLLFNKQIFIKISSCKDFCTINEFSDFHKKIPISVKPYVSFVEIPNDAEVCISNGTLKSENLILKHECKVNEDFKIDDWILSNNIVGEEEIYNILKDNLEDGLYFAKYISDKFLFKEKTLDICYNIFVNYYEKNNKFYKIPKNLKNEKFYLKILNKYRDYLCKIDEEFVSVNFWATIVNKSSYDILVVPKHILENNIFIKELKKNNKWNDKTHHLIKNTEFKRIIFITFMCLNKKYKGNTSIFLHIFSLLFDYYFI